MFLPFLGIWLSSIAQASWEQRIVNLVHVLISQEASRKIQFHQPSYFLEREGFVNVIHSMVLCRAKVWSSLKGFPVPLCWCSLPGSSCWASRSRAEQSSQSDWDRECAQSSCTLLPGDMPSTQGLIWSLCILSLHTALMNLLSSFSSPPCTFGKWGGFARRRHAVHSKNWWCLVRSKEGMEEL